MTEKEKFLRLTKVPDEDGVPVTFALFGRSSADMDKDELRATCLWLAAELRKFNHPFAGRYK